MPGTTVVPGAGRSFEFQINATQSWNLDHLTRRRRRSAKAERAVLSAEVRAQRLRARLEAARYWIDLHTVERLDALVARQIEIAREQVSTHERAVSAGVVTTVDLAEAEHRLAELEQVRLSLQGQRFEAANRLTTAMGQPVPTEFLETVGEVHTDGPLPRPDLPQKREVRSRLAEVDALPSVAVHRLEETAARARAAEAAAAYAPSLLVGGQGEYGYGNVWTGYAVLGMSFTLAGQGRRAQSKAEADARRAVVDTEVERRRAASELSMAWHELEHARAEERVLVEERLPAIETLRQRRERAAAIGESTVFELFETRRREVEVQMELERARGRYAWAAVRLWMLLAQLQTGEGS
jgi:outer membrane protein TolC